MKLHFVGICGIGMSGIAEVFHNQGYQVTGSDLTESDTARRLRDLGITVRIGHRPENVAEAKVVVISSAVKLDNPEVIEARRLRIPVIPRAEMLAELMRGKVGIAIAGSHGKTTTTSLMASVLMSAGLDPTLVIGGRVDSLGGANSKLGQGRYVVAEADESDGSFLQLPATYAILTNIDNDHLDFYGNLSNIENAFIHFVSKLPFYGLAAVCGDDPGIQRCLTLFSKPIITYGLNDGNDLQAVQVKLHGTYSEFLLLKKGIELGMIRVPLPGLHNVLNTLGVIAICDQLQIGFDAIQTGLSTFRGVKRRFDIRWKSEDGKRVIMDDYAHHPTEIMATLSAARCFWQGRIIAVFQPHRYSRTLHCRDGFSSAFHGADEVWITDLYSAGEDPIAGVNSPALVEYIRRFANAGQKVIHSGSLEQTVVDLMSQFRDGDLILGMGAGSITKLPDLLIFQLKAKAETSYRP